MGHRDALGQHAVFRGPDRVRDQPVRGASARTCLLQRTGPEPDPAAPGHADPPPHSLYGIRWIRDPVRVRVRGTRVTPTRHHLVPDDAPLDHHGLVLSRLRDHARGPLGLRGARLGRLLGLGPRRECLSHAVPGRHRLPALGDHPGEARDAPDLESRADRSRLLSLPVRHLPHAQRSRAVGSQLHAIRLVRLCVPGLRGGHGQRVFRNADLAGSPAPQQEPARLDGLARGQLPAQQLRVPGALFGRVFWHALPGLLRSSDRPEDSDRPTLLSALRRTARTRTAVSHRRRTADRLETRHLGQPAQELCVAGSGCARSHERGGRARRGPLLPGRLRGPV